MPIRLHNSFKACYIVLESGMHTAVLKEINSTCDCFSKEVILEEFEAYFDVLERKVFHDLLK